MAGLDGRVVSPSLGNCAKLRPVLERIKSRMRIPLIQGTLRYAYKVQFMGGTLKEKAEGYTFAAGVTFPCPILLTSPPRIAHVWPPRVLSRCLVPLLGTRCLVSSFTPIDACHWHTLGPIPTPHQHHDVCTTRVCRCYPRCTLAPPATRRSCWPTCGKAPPRRIKRPSRRPSSETTAASTFRAPTWVGCGRQASTTTTTAPVRRQSRSLAYASSFPRCPLADSSS